MLRNSNADDRSRDAAAKIHEETRGLTRMITNLLDIGRADEGQLAPARRMIDAHELVAAVLEELRPRAAAAELELRARVEAGNLFVDRDLIQRVLVNLVENAIRHAPTGSAIEVVVQSAADAVELRVADAGPGVPPELREQIFERFVTKGEGSTRTNRGLGLAFCKVAVEAHGGQIAIEDGVPGAIFCLRIPHAQ